jgi:hypothetical protein
MELRRKIYLEFDINQPYIKNFFEHVTRQMAVLLIKEFDSALHLELLRYAAYGKLGSSPSFPYVACIIFSNEEDKLAFVLEWS